MEIWMKIELVLWTIAFYHSLSLNSLRPQRLQNRGVEHCFQYLTYFVLFLPLPHTTRYASIPRCDVWKSLSYDEYKNRKACGQVWKLKKKKSVNESVTSSRYIKENTIYYCLWFLHSYGKQLWGTPHSLQHWGRICAVAPELLTPGPHRNSLSYQHRGKCVN